MSSGKNLVAATGRLDVHLFVDDERPYLQSATTRRAPIQLSGFGTHSKFRNGHATLIRRSDSSEAAAVVHELRQVEAPQQCDEADRNNAIVIIPRSSQWLGMCGLFGITNQQMKSGGQRITR